MTDVGFSVSCLFSWRCAIQVLLLPCLALLAGVATQNGFPGSVIALVPLAMLALICSPLRWHQRNAGFRIFLIFALGGTAAIAIEPGLLNLAITWFTLAMLVFCSRGGSLSNSLQNLLAIGQQLAHSPVASARLLNSAREAYAITGPAKLDWRKAALPVLSVLTFTLLFMVSNTAFQAVVSNMFSLRLDFIWIQTALVFAIALQLLWAITEIRAARLPAITGLEGEAPAWHASLFSPGPVIVTLAAVNAVFLLQNMLDLQNLWVSTGGAPGRSYAAYAQQGAGTLIVTILLAALLMILALWPGTRTNASPSVRVLVYLWIAQNCFLLASCAARLMSYVDAYGMTMWRLASFIWMGLIGCGLLLVVMRILWSRSNLWLVNANIAASFLVLWGSGFIDYRAIVANYNESRNTPGYRGGDFEYLESLGPSALPALVRLSANRQHTWRVQLVRSRLMEQQADWRTWTLRGALISAAISSGNLPLQPESEKVPECQSSSTLPGSSGMNSPGAGCPAPNLQPGQR